MDRPLPGTEPKSSDASEIRAILLEFSSPIQPAQVMALMTWLAQASQYGMPQLTRTSFIDKVLSDLIAPAKAGQPKSFN